ncbi:MAG TPA: FHA domain-containing protein [Ktedonobacteraceae bacterium]|nr:FHA domain-containing protein [Ktedonobacteraceae bacterium]
MDARFYNSEEIDIERVATDLENMFRTQGYETQQLGNKDQIMVQLKKGGELAALVGLQTALTLTMQRTNGGVVAMIGQQKWVDKAAVGAVGLVAAPFIPILWPLLVTAGAGAIKQATLGNNVLNTVDGLVRQQAPGVQAGPLPGSLAPQFQQYWAQPPQQYAPPQYVPPTPVYTPPPAPTYAPPTPVYTPTPAKPRCPSCNTSYEPGDTFCSGCGRALTPPKSLCPTCKAELKPGVAFCPKCGANTFQATSSQPAKSAPTVAPTRPATPVYTPKQETPVYTPPKPQTPVYRPPTPVYTPPAKPAEPEPYVPPVPKEPPVVPQPTVTIVPGSTKPATPPPAPKAPPVPVYIPPSPVQPPTVAAQPQAQTPPVSQTIKARPTSAASAGSNQPWGTLIFTNGREVVLSGERVLVGRSDHDLGGGVQPEVDLAAFEHADTVSRGHATIEHIGSTYQLTDLHSTNFSRVNGKRLEPSVPTPINDGDTLQFGKIQCTFKKSQI